MTTYLTISLRRAAVAFSGSKLPAYCYLILLCSALTVAAADDKPANHGSRQPVQASPCNDVPVHAFDIILARPTANSVTVSVLCYDDAVGSISYGTQAGKPTLTTASQVFKQGEPVAIVLAALQPDTRYFYQLNLRHSHSPEGTFHTARPPGQPFSFTLTADSHLDSQTDPIVYQNTLANARADHADFHIDLGDTFMTEKHADRAGATRQYLAQRYYFGQLAPCSPLLLVLGNHDGESPRGSGSESESLAVWSNTMRKTYFPNPQPDGFYTGNATRHPAAGLLQDYYAWQWGDALFVVLDPFWFSQQQRGRHDNWQRTLGMEQYQWLKNTLETSKSTYKFVFIHNLVGGADEQGRGGVSAAPLFEWGGNNPDGSDGFKQNRLGWPAPVHQLLVRNKVNIVFHGHDHLYAKQQLDGIIYQEVPQPGYPGTGKAPRAAADYGYVQGTIIGSSGHLRVSGRTAATMVEYLRSQAPTVATGHPQPAVIADSYTVVAP